MKNLKHYTFVFTNNSGDTVATMTMTTPVKIDVFELGKDCTNRTCEWSTCSYSNN